MLSVTEIFYHELLLFGSFWLLIGAFDDLLIDLIWIGRRGYRRFVYYREQPPLRADQLSPPTRRGQLAVFIPTWQEAAVIDAMLAQCASSWQSAKSDYRIYVGCYVNDEAGIAKISQAAAQNPNVKLVTLPHCGPTTKADCLNGLWKALLADELHGGYKAKAVILHDAEDCVHADELLIFDRLIEKNAAVQLPVIPIRTSGSQWISGHYCDEFAEAHGKTMVVREALGAALPLAGVGCAIDRNVLGRIAYDNGGSPFDEGSLTEDYELGLRISAVGGRAIMARILDNAGELVGTRAHFPETLSASVRQKSRWLTGIAFAGWDRIGWQGSVADKWMLLHDRKSILSALVLLVAYACILLAVLLAAMSMSGLHNSAPLPPLLIIFLKINAVFVVWRIGVRAAFVWSLYGVGQAALSIPRSFIANFIAIMAAGRACVAYLLHCFGRPLLWEKTTHSLVPTGK